MADSEKIIDPDGTPGVDCDYNSLSDWAAWAQTQGSSGDQNTAVCRSSGGSADTGAVNLTGWVSGVMPWITADAGHEASLTAWYTDRYRLEVTNANCISSSVPGGVFEEIQVKLNVTTGNYRSGFSLAAESTVQRCRIRGSISAGVSNRGVYMTGSGINFYILNNLIEGFVYDTTGCDATTCGASVSYWYNNTAVNCGRGYACGSSFSARTRNCIAQNCSDGYAGNHHSDSDFNLSDLSSDAPGSNSVQSTLSFVGSEDYHLAAGDTDAMGAGIGPDSDAQVPSIDFDGDSRSGTTTDIGADLYTASGTQVALQDTGSGTDALGSVAAGVPVGETGSGSDVIGGIGAGVPVADSGAGSDAVGGLAALLALAESGAGADTVSGVSAAASVTETGGGADGIGQLLTAIAQQDTGSGTDALGSVAAGVPVGETGSGSDVIGGIGAGVPVADSGAGSDAVGGLAALLALAESGAGMDGITVTVGGVTIQLTDSGTALDIIAGIAAHAALADAVGGNDAATVTASVPLSDSGVGVDAAAVARLIQIIDAATGSDGFSIAAASLLSEAGHGAETISAAAVAALAEAAYGSDAVRVRAEAEAIIVKIRMRARVPGASMTLREPSGRPAARVPGVNIRII